MRVLPDFFGRRPQRTPDHGAASDVSRPRSIMDEPHHGIVKAMPWQCHRLRRPDASSPTGGAGGYGSESRRTACLAADDELFASLQSRAFRGELVTDARRDEDVADRRRRAASAAAAPCCRARRTLRGLPRAGSVAARRRRCWSSAAGDGRRTASYIDLLAIDADGNLHVLELKRDKTPRDVVAQVLDYGSWVTTLIARGGHRHRHRAPRRAVRGRVRGRVRRAPA